MLQGEKMPGVRAGQISISERGTREAKEGAELTAIRVCGVSGVRKGQLPFSEQDHTYTTLAPSLHPAPCAGDKELRDEATF